MTDTSSDKGIHLAIIPDGNRRWAKERSFSPWDGHKQAIENFRSLTEWCRKDPRVDILTVWCFSTENWNRDPEEIDQLMNILETYLGKERKGFIEQQTKFLHAGRKDRLPKSLVALLKDVEEETKDQTGFTLQLAIDYGGKDEVLRAVNKAKDTGDITEESLRRSFDQPSLPDIDLIIRTSGEYRTSNFFLWESAYAEWVFLKELFPDVTTQHLEEAMEEFQRRTRRFGA